MSSNIRERLVIPFSAADMRLGGWAGKRRQAIESLVADAGCSDSASARRLGVRRHLVTGVRRELEQAGTFPQPVGKHEGNRPWSIPPKVE